MASGEVLNVPADGHCLFACAVAARDVDRLRSLSQDGFGFLRSQREDRELATACARLRAIVADRAVHDGRYDVVDQLTSSSLPEGAILHYVAEWLGGSVHVTVDGLDTEYDVLFGEGPIVCKLLLTYQTGPDGAPAPHYNLVGSWMAQLKTRKRSRAERAKTSGSSSSASSTASM